MLPQGPARTRSFGSLPSRTVAHAPPPEQLPRETQTHRMAVDRAGPSWKKQTSFRGSWKLWLLPGCPYEENIPSVGRNNLNSSGVTFNPLADHVAFAECCSVGTEVRPPRRSGSSPVNSHPDSETFASRQAPAVLCAVSGAGVVIFLYSLA